MAIISSRFLPMFKNGIEQADKISQNGQKFSLAAKGETISFSAVPESLKSHFKETDIIIRVKSDQMTDEDKKSRIQFHSVEFESYSHDPETSDWKYYAL